MSGRGRFDAAVSVAEARVEALKGPAGLVLSPVAAVVAWLAVAGEDGPARRLAGLMALVAVLWIAESIPVAITSLLAAAGVVLLGIAPAKEAFAAFGTPLLFLFIGSFFIAEAMVLHGLSERFASAVARIARGRLGSLVALSLGAFALSLWTSNAAATAVFLPVAVSVAQASGDRRFGAALVLAIAWGASVGGIGTPVGTPPNLIGIAALRERAGVEVSFFRWTELCLPLALVMQSVLLVLLALRFGIWPGVPLGAGPAGPPRPWSRGEIGVLFSFLVAVVLWVTPGVLDLTGPDWLARWAKTHLTEEIAAVLAASILFVWPAGKRGARRPVLTWKEAAGIDWSTVLLFGGGVLLGELAGKTGLAARMGAALQSFTGVESLWALTALLTGASILLSEATSNTATATLMLPLALSLAKAAGVSPVPPALGATLGASFGFMLPISTAPNALAYGTRRVTILEMASTGVAFDLLGFVAIVAGLRVLCPALGFI